MLNGRVFRLAQIGAEPAHRLAHVSVDHALDVKQLKSTADAQPAALAPATPPHRPSQSGDAAGVSAAEVRWEVRYESKGIELDAWLKAFSDQLMTALQRAGSLFAHNYPSPDTSIAQADAARREPRLRNASKTDSSIDCARATTVRRFPSASG
jgi:hypothetical protein